MATRARRACARRPTQALADGVNILILSDRAIGPERAPIPSLLAVAAVHHHLVREGTRLQTGLVLESGEPREVHHFATLIGYGASAINPYLMFESLAELVADGPRPERRRLRDGRAERRQGHRQGPAQDDLEDGHLDDPVLQRGADLRGRRARAGADRRAVRRHRVADRRHRARRAGGRDARAPRARLRASTDDLLPVGGVYAWRREGEHHMWNPETIALLQHSVRHGGQPTYDEYAKLVNDDAAAPGDAARAAEVPRAARGPVARPRRGRAGERDRQALRHRRDVAGLAVARGARDARDRDEPDRRQVEHRRGRGGPGPLHARPERRPAPLGDQAGGVRPLRGQHQLPRQRRRAADQDGPGRQARRGRPAARPQGRPLHRLDPLHDPGRGPDLAAAAPRHLLDRGPQAADLRPALRQPGRARVGQARERGRRRDGRGRRGQGQRRPRADRRPRRRHRRLAAFEHPGRGHPVGDRPRRDAADAGAQRPALAASGSRPTASSRPAATS